MDYGKTVEIKTFSEKEIKQWFDKMKKKYPNSDILQHLEAVEYMMFNKVFDDSDCLEKIKERG